MTPPARPIGLVTGYVQNDKPDGRVCGYRQWGPMAGVSVADVLSTGSLCRPPLTAALARIRSIARSDRATGILVDIGISLGDGAITYR